MPALGSSANTIASLSRAFSREIENLPTRNHKYGLPRALVPSSSACREFYEIKVEDDVKALLNPESPGFKARYKRISRVRFGCNSLVSLSLK